MKMPECCFCLSSLLIKMTIINTQATYLEANLRKKMNDSARKCQNFGLIEKCH